MLDQTDSIHGPAAPAPPSSGSWTEPHPEIAYLPKPPHQLADWIVEQDPVNPNATPQARALLHYLYEISGKQTMTGQHNFPGRRSYSTEWATALTGKPPALYGSDWGFAKAEDKDTAYERDEIVQELVARWEGGAVITLCWHEVPPTEDEPVTFQRSVQSRLTDEQFADVLMPGTRIHDRWCAQVDVIAGFLKQLQAANVPILWRPYHEINGDWFWWNGHRGGAQDGTKQLYRQLYDRYVTLHRLDNLLWVWNPDRPSQADRQFVDYFPGLECVDVLAFDCYGAFEQSYYDDLNALSGGKVMAIGETAEPPTLEIYRTQPKWAYYMRWAIDTPADGGQGANHGGARPDLQAMVQSPRMLSLTDPDHRDKIETVRSRVRR